MKVLLFASTLFLALTSFAEFKTSQEAENKLKAFVSKNFVGKADKDVVAMEDDLVDSLIDAVELSVKEPKNDNLKKEVLRAAVVLLKQDKTNYGGEIVLPLYNQNDVEFKNILKYLPTSDARLLEKAVLDAKREQESGNGGPDSVK